MQKEDRCKHYKGFEFERKIITNITKALNMKGRSLQTLDLRGITL